MEIIKKGTFCVFVKDKEFFVELFKLQNCLVFTEEYEGN